MENIGYANTIKSICKLSLIISQLQSKNKGGNLRPTRLSAARSFTISLRIDEPTKIYHASSLRISDSSSSTPVLRDFTRTRIKKIITMKWQKKVTLVPPKYTTIDNPIISFCSIFFIFVHTNPHNAYEPEEPSLSATRAAKESTH